MDSRADDVAGILARLDPEEAEALRVVIVEKRCRTIRWLLAQRELAG